MLKRKAQDVGGRTKDKLKSIDTSHVCRVESLESSIKFAFTRTILNNS